MHGAAISTAASDSVWQTIPAGRQRAMSSILHGQRVLITGAASGLGRALAQQLAALGTELLLLDVDQARLDAAAAALIDTGANVRAYVCDVSDHAQVADTFERIAADVDSLDALVNNAGIWTDNEIEARQPARRCTAMLVNAVGPMQVTDAALPLLRRSTAPAQIINVISSSGALDTEFAESSRWITYGASKRALAGYTATLTAKLAPERIRVSAILPAGFESDMYEFAGSVDEHHDAAWMMRTEDVAETIVFAMTRPPDVRIEQLLVTKVLPVES